MVKFLWEDSHSRIIVVLGRIWYMSGDCSVLRGTHYKESSLLVEDFSVWKNLSKENLIEVLEKFVMIIHYI